MRTSSTNSPASAPRCPHERGHRTELERPGTRRLRPRLGALAEPGGHGPCRRGLRAHAHDHPDERARGRASAPKGTGIIVAAYHANHLDPILVGLALKRNGRMPHFLAKSSLFSGVLGIILKRIGQIPVLRASAQA